MHDGRVLSREDRPLAFGAPGTSGIAPRFSIESHADSLSHAPSAFAYPSHCSGSLRRNHRRGLWPRRWFLLSEPEQ